MSSESASAAARPIIYLGMDVHKESITIAVLPAGAKVPTQLDRLPNDLAKLTKWIDRVAREGEMRACYEASGAGYVLHRALQDWGYLCDVIAPSLIPIRSGVQRKHDKRDATDLARRYRAGELVAVRIPSEADERVRDVVRCRETFQREILKSRHYVLIFLARRGFVFRDGTNWSTPHLQWLQHLTTDGSPLAAHDRLVFREYHALLMYKLQRRHELDRQIEQLAGLPALAPMVARLPCFRGISLHSAMGTSHRDCGLAPLRASLATRLLPRPRLARGFERRADATRLHHQGRERALPPRPRPGGLELSASTADERRSQAPPGGAAAGGDHARLEGATAAASALPSPLLP